MIMIIIFISVYINQVEISTVKFLDIKKVNKTKKSRLVFCHQNNEDVFVVNLWNRYLMKLAAQQMSREIVFYQ